MIQHERKNLARADLNEKEIALLELLRAPEIYVEAGWDVLARKVSSALRAGEVRSDLLREAVPGEDNRAVRDNFARPTATDCPATNSSPQMVHKKSAAVQRVPGAVRPTRCW